MEDKDKTNKQFSKELKQLRQRIAELEKFEAKYKRAEEALQSAYDELKEREKLYRTLVDNIDLGISLIDADHTIVIASAAEGKHFKRPISDFIGKKCFREFEKRETVCPHCPGVRAMATGQPAAVETEGIRDNSSRYNVRIQAFPVFGDDGRATGFIEIYENITERLQTQKVLQESELQYRTTLNSMGDAIHVIDTDFRFMLFNDAFKQWNEALGLETDVIGRTVFEIFPFLTDNVRDEYRRVFDTGEILMTEENTTIHGREFVTETRKIPIYEGGKVTRVVTVVRDITDRKQAEEALRGNAEQYRIITNTTMDGFVKLDLEGRILDLNETYCQMLAYSKEELLKMTIMDIEAKETPEKVKKHLKEIIEAGSDRFESRLRRKDGYIIDVEISLTLLRQLGHILVFARDITDRKQAEEALRRSYDQLRETFIATVNALASTVEMKDPYTAGHQRWVTRLACAIAKEMNLSEEQIEGIRMAGLIHDIGKINIPAEILTKPGHLSEIQYNMVKIHPQVGCDILKEIKFPWPVAEIVQQHHERMDGSGYPQGFSGTEILLEARILAVADVVEAMASHRPYRAAHGVERALDEISRNKGTLYDPDVVDVCLKLFEQGFRFD
jgi:PAS domain S-box-containing protein/putative nucleotidyltransferase with HDIG domain